MIGFIHRDRIARLTFFTPPIRDDFPPGGARRIDIFRLLRQSASSDRPFFRTFDRMGHIKPDLTVPNKF